jgi:outer membrane protein, multidrug efflux system
MRQLAAWAAAVSMGWLTGCDLAPQYHSPNFLLPASYQGAGPWQVAHPRDQIPRGPWWRAYGNPTLNDLETQIPYNPNLLAQRESFRQARDLAAEAASGLYPHLGANFLMSANRESPEQLWRSSNNTAPLTEASVEPSAAASWEIDVWKRIGNETRAQKHRAQALAADVAAVELILQAELANAYLTLRGLDQNARLYRNVINSYQKALDITRMRLSDKIGSQLDVARAESQLSSTRAQLNNIMGQRALAQHAIATLIGRPATSFALPPQDATPLHLPRIPTGMPSTLLERRPDIAAAERNMAAANAEIGVARAAFYPNLSLNAIFGIIDRGFNVFSLPNQTWSVGANVAQPLFEGGLLRARLDAANSSYRQTVDLYRYTVLTGFQEVEDQLSLNDWLAKEVAEDQRASNATSQAQNLAMQLYVSGASSYLEVTVAQVAYFQAASSQIGNMVRLQQASINLVRALGGGWTADQLPKEKDILPFNPLTPWANDRKLAS